MSLLRGRSALIIGAGASVPFGVASGIGMMRQLSDAIGEELSNWEAIRIGKVGSQLKPFLLSRSISMAENGMFSFSSNDSVELLEQLQSLLNDQTSDTIDDLIRMNSDHASLLKRAIAFCVFSRIYALRTDEARYNTYSLRRLENREIENIAKKISKGEFSIGHPVHRNWIHHFINLSRQRVLSAREAEIPTIISFNYDGILEFVLKKQWNNAGNIKLGNWEDHIMIIHPHGYMKIDKDSYSVVEAAELVKKWGAEIRIVDETMPGKHKEVQDCRDAIAASSNIFGAGFAFAKSNCDLIGLEGGMAGGGSHSIPKRLHFMNYDDSYGLRARVKQYCFLDLGGVNSTNLIEHRPDRGNVLELDEAIAGGLLGEMPA
jgi:hypothetical protein